MDGFERAGWRSQWHAWLEDGLVVGFILGCIVGAAFSSELPIMLLGIPAEKIDRSITASSPLRALEPWLFVTYILRCLFVPWAVGWYRRGLAGGEGRVVGWPVIIALCFWAAAWHLAFA